MTMRALYTILAVLPLASFAQTTWTVNVGGSTQSGTPPYYTPQDLTIDVGDIVHWVRDNGTHNINGSVATFPGNPEGFFSGTPDNTVFPWDYTFNIPGVYHYHCDQMGHSATQFGMITVLNPAGVDEANRATTVNLFPVPTSGTLIIDVADGDIRKAEVFSLDGRPLINRSVEQGSARLVISVEELAAGHYFLRLTEANGQALTRPFTKE